ncbi:unnamed protein product [Sphagnum balticum]
MLLLLLLQFSSFGLTTFQVPNAANNKLLLLLTTKGRGRCGVRGQCEEFRNAGITIRPCLLQKSGLSFSVFRC